MRPACPLVPLALLLVGLCAAPLAAQPPAQVAPPTEEEVLRPLEDPAVATVKELNPQTPAELLQAVVTLLNLEAPDDARVYFDKLVKAKLDEAALADLTAKFDGATLLRLAVDPRLAPEGAQFIDALLAAADKRSRDPARLAALVAELKNPQPELRAAAIVQLREAKVDAVTYLLSALADPKQAGDRPTLGWAVVQMESVAIGPLLGALDAQDPQFRAIAMELLGELGSAEAAIFLTGPAVLEQHDAPRAAAQRALVKILGQTPSAAQARAALLRRVERYFAGIRPTAPDHEGLVEVWGWDDERRRSTRQRIPADDVGLIWAARLTPSLYALAPDDTRIRQLNFTALLEAAKVRDGYDRPLPADSAAYRATAAALEPAELEALLEFAQETRHFGAALAVCQLLGDRGGVAQLMAPGGRTAPLVRALEHGDRRLKFAALAAIMQISPQQPFAGSSYLTDALGFFTSTAAEPRAVVGHPRAAQAQDLAALLGALGFQADVAYRGQRVLQLAQSSADLELVLVHSTIDNPPLRELLYQLRRDPRTSRLPIGIVAGIEDLERMKTLAATDPLTDAFARPHSVESLAAELAELRKQVGRNLISPAERMAQAAQALAWIDQLASSPAKFYDLRQLEADVIQALAVPELTAPAATVLAQLGMPRGQRALADLASRQSPPLPARQAAADAFRQSVAKHGVLLTTDEILKQYDLYNASETADPATQKLRSGLLDALESKTQTQTKTKSPAGEAVK